MNENKRVKLMKLNKILLDEIKFNKMKKTMKFKTDIKNCLVTYCSSNIFKLSVLSKVSMSFIEIYFSMTADSDNFLELDCISIRKILSSSGLNIDSELQVFNAADSWLSHDITKRSIYAKNLLSKVRLSLLSIPALNKILNRVSSSYNECSDDIEAVLVKKQQSKSISSKITSRYCSQTNFKIFVCGGENVGKKKVSHCVKFFNANNFNKVNILPNKKEVGICFRAFCIKGELYVFGGNGGRKMEKYSPDTNTWKHVTHVVDNRSFFCFCSFMDNVYIIGGIMGNFIRGNGTATCFEFNTKSLKWKIVSKMNDVRESSACSVFEGKIVVSGGYYNGNGLNTVEAYDHVENTWKNMPSMIAARSCHKSVAVKNKLFVITKNFRNNCEVFDSTTKKFTLLKQPTPLSDYNFNGRTEVITIGSKIFLFQDNSRVITYDLEYNEWSRKTCKATKHLTFFYILKYQ